MSIPVKSFFGRPIPVPTAVPSTRGLSHAIDLALADLFHALRIPTDEAHRLVRWTFELLETRLPADILEAHMRSQYSLLVRPAALRLALDERARVVAQQVGSHIRGLDLLDIGCGDGMVAQFLVTPGWRIRLFDVVRRVDSRVSLPFCLIEDHGRVALPREADTALLLTVLHHAPRPGDLIESVAAAAPKRIVIIESVLDVPTAPSPLEDDVASLGEDDRYKFCAFFDWLFNRVVTDNKYVPFNFGYVREWQSAFASVGYALTSSVTLGIDQRLVPEVHQLMVFERTSGT